MSPENPEHEFVSQEELKELREKEKRLHDLESWLGPRLLHLFDARNRTTFKHEP